MLHKQLMSSEEKFSLVVARGIFATNDSIKNLEQFISLLSKTIGLTSRSTLQQIVPQTKSSAKVLQVQRGCITVKRVQSG